MRSETGTRFRDGLRHGTGRVLAGSLVMGLIGMGLTLLSIQGLATYGLGLYLLLPFVMGLASVLLVGSPANRDRKRCLTAAVLPILFEGLLLLAFAREGLICLLMAAPIGLGLAFLGGMLGCAVAQRRTTPVPPVILLLVLASVPLAMGMERSADRRPALLSVTSSITIDARPERIWPHLPAFPPIEARPDWILRTGIACPTGARIDGHGIGAVRHCVFTTGEFVEPIDVWDEPRLLGFSVARQPAPMRELTPWPNLQVPHLDHYFQSIRGELRLIPLPDGRTRLQGTTWYTNRIWPVAYWKAWSDLLIHRIHIRVLTHIKALSERPAEG